MLKRHLIDLAFQLWRRDHSSIGADGQSCRFLVAVIMNLGLAFEVRGQTGNGPCTPEMARLTSVQGEVELRENEAMSWRPAGLDDVLCIGTTIRVGAFSRAALVFANESTLRLDQDTTLSIRAQEEERRTWLEMLTGAIHFFSHRPRALRIDTPYVNAAAEGTEFLIRLGAERAHVITYEGMVLVENAEGRLLRGPGDAALIRPGEAPVPEVIVRPRDAVAWTLHYPPLLAPLADGGTPGALPAPLQRAVERFGANDPPGALAALDEVPAAGRDVRYEIFRAGILLNVGRVDEAEAAIGRALAMDPESSLALAQRSVLNVVRNDRARARLDADRAVELAPGSSTALIAQSYARQSDFDLEGARESLYRAVEAEPDDALAFARLAEIELSFGDYDKASTAAAEATRLAPDLARTQTVRGFAYLTEIDIPAAKYAFKKAILEDSTDPLPRLGFGLAKIREGDLEAGRQDLEIAASLDPNNALIRSYLGKAYFEEKRGPKDADQFAIAKALDPNDPTPWLYNAIAKQSENRPVEALEDLQTSIALNDNRAVYRSRLLLDEDIAVRSARLGRIYNDLGFEQLALVQGWRAVARDPGSHSAHRLLADNYAALPRHEIARNSELLQAQLLQPLSLNPVQPALADSRLDFLTDTGPNDIGFNELTRLFVRNDPALVAGEFLAGEDNTFVDNIIVSGLYNSLSYSVGQFHLETDGVRPNNFTSQNIYNSYAQWSLSPKTSFIGELRYETVDTGDFNLLFDDTNFLPGRRIDVETKSARLGLRHDLTPSATLLASYLHNELDVTDQLPELGDLAALADEKLDLVELRLLKRNRRFNIDAGVSALDGELSLQTTIADALVADDRGDINYYSSYVYGTYNPTDALSITAGVSADYLDDPTLQRQQINPKLGVSWQVFDRTTLRAAAFRVLQRPTSYSRTIEPTQVAGFNQFFDDFVGADTWRYGAAVDHALNRSNFIGAEYSERELDNHFPGLGETDSDERLSRFYYYSAPTDRIAGSIEYQFEKKTEDPRISMFSVEDVRTHRVPVTLRYFHPQGMFAQARVTFGRQKGNFIDQLSGAVTADSDEFLVTDIALGHRFSNRIGIASVEIRNLFDERFNFQESQPGDPGYSRDRAIFVRLALSF